MASQRLEEYPSRRLFPSLLECLKKRGRFLLSMRILRGSIERADDRDFRWRRTKRLAMNRHESSRKPGKMKNEGVSQINRHGGRVLCMPVYRVVNEISVRLSVCYINVISLLLRSPM